MKKILSIVFLFCVLYIQSCPLSAQDKVKVNDENKTKKEQVKEKDNKCDDSSCKKPDKKDKK